MEEQIKSKLKDLIKKEKERDKERQDRLDKEQKKKNEFLEESSRVLNEIIEPEMRKFQEFLTSEGKSCKVETKTGNCRLEYGDHTCYISFSVDECEKKITVETRIPSNLGNIMKEDCNISEITSISVEFKIFKMIESYHKMIEGYSKKY